MTKAIVIFALLVANLSSVACACSCRPGMTLEQKYQRADNILIAKISACAPDRLSEDGHCRSHGWTFETVENLKGSDALVRALPTDTGPAVSTCDMSLKVGDTYLLFLQDGRTSLCAGTGSLRGEVGARTLREVEILRAYRDGAITRITEPWYFMDSGWQCGIDHQLGGAAYIRFSYAYAVPPTEARHEVDTNPVPSMTLWPVGSFVFAGPTLLEVNGELVPLARTTTVQLPDGRAFSVDVMVGDAVLGLLDRMSQPAALVVSGTRSAHANATEPFRATTTTARVAEVAAKFRSCIAAHAVVNRERG